MREKLALDDESEWSRQRASQLQLREPIRRDVWRQRSTSQPHEEQFVVEREVGSALDRGALRS